MHCSKTRYYSSIWFTGTGKRGVQRHEYLMRLFAPHFWWRKLNIYFWPPRYSEGSQREFGLAPLRLRIEMHVKVALEDQQLTENDVLASFAY